MTLKSWKPVDGWDAPRVPPHNFEAEQALLGAILLNNQAAGRVSELLRPEHFAEPLHGRIYASCVALVQTNHLADANTVHDHMGADADLLEAGGHAYLGRLTASATTIIGAPEYARVIHEMHLRRELIALGEDIVNHAFEPRTGQTAKEQFDEAFASLSVLENGLGAVAKTWQQAAQWIGAAIDQAQAVYRDGRSADAIETGIGPLDRRIGGLHASELIVLAGRPGSGKSALAQSIATNVARRGIPVFMFSHEMSAISLGQRALASETGVSGWKQRHGPLEQEQIESLIGAADRLRSLPLLVDDSPTLTVAQINRRARRIAKPGAQGLVVVDQLSHVKPEPGSDRQPRYQQVGAITRGFKEMAKELGLPVLLLSQLSRGVEARDDKRPRASDLRESGDIEGDADMILMVYREFTYLERSKPQQKEKEDPNDYRGRLAKWQTALEDCRHKTEVIIEKQRMGATGSAELYFDAERTSFTAPEGDVGSDLD